MNSTVAAWPDCEEYAYYRVRSEYGTVYLEIAAERHRADFHITQLLGTLLYAQKC